MGQEFEGKILFATGASSGIGRETAIAFARAGGHVAAIGRSELGLAQTAAAVEAAGARVITCVCDVSHAPDVENAIARAKHAFGGFDFALNCAGIGQVTAHLADVEEEDWDRVFGINAKGLWLCLRAQLRHMLACGSGAIVNVTSSLADHSMPAVGVYAASKHAAAGLTKAAAIDYAQSGIRINAIAPGPVLTPILDRALETMPAGQRSRGTAFFADSVPMRRLGTPAEVADAVLFLLSNRASFITGACLSVDGGMSAN